MAEQRSTSPLTARKGQKRIGQVVLGWKIEALIGWGASAKVFRARHLNFDREAAIKIINKPRSRIGDLKRTFTECTILSKLSHGNIVSMYEWTETDKHFFIVMELARDGDLLEYLTAAPEPLAEQKIMLWFAQLVDALAYAHTAGYAHKDIKPDNILLNGDRILLADWGYAHEYSYDAPHRAWTGTDGYWSPEIMHNRPHYGPEADCWSLGVTLYAMASGRLPFNRNAPTYIDDVTNARFSVPKRASPELTSMIESLIVADSAKRSKISDVLRHPFYLEGKRLVQASPFSSPRNEGSVSTLSVVGIVESPSKKFSKRRPTPATLTMSTKINDTPAATAASASPTPTSVPSTPIQNRRSSFALARDAESPPDTDTSRRSSFAENDDDHSGIDFAQEERKEAELEALRAKEKARRLSLQVNSPQPSPSPSPSSPAAAAAASASPRQRAQSGQFSRPGFSPIRSIKNLWGSIFSSKKKTNNNSNNNNSNNNDKR